MLFGSIRLDFDESISWFIYIRYYKSKDVSNEKLKIYLLDLIVYMVTLFKKKKLTNYIIVHTCLDLLYLISNGDDHFPYRVLCYLNFE